MQKQKIGIVGSGPAGLTAAIYSARSEYEVMLFAGSQPFGQLMNTREVENYPGHVSITGPELMNQMQKQAEHSGANIIQEQVTSVTIEEGLFKITTNESAYFVNSCIIATGSKPKLLELESEKTFWSLGVSTCATCDGPLYKNKIVCVIGGGNTAAEEAIFLSGIASKVYLIHRRDTMRADNILQKKLFERTNVEYFWDSEVQEFVGDTHLTGVMIYNKKNENLSKLDVDGAFIAIGHIPQTDLLKDLCPMENGYVKADFIAKRIPPKTNVAGLFVAGDIADHIYRQAVTAAGDGCRAALEAIRFLQLGRKVRIYTEKNVNTVKIEDRIAVNSGDHNRPERRSPNRNSYREDRRDNYKRRDEKPRGSFGGRDRRSFSGGFDRRKPTNDRPANDRPANDRDNRGGERSSFNKPRSYSSYRPTSSSYKPNRSGFKNKSDRR